MTAVKPAPHARGLLVTLAIGAAAIGYIYLLFLPQQRAIADMRGEIEQQRLIVLSGESLRPALAQCAADLAAAEQFVARWRADAPTAGELSRFHAELVAIASQAGVQVQRIDPLPVERLATLAEAPLELVVLGQFTEVFAFLRSLESLPPTVWVNQVRLEAVEKPAPHVRGEIRLSLFVDNSAGSG